MARVLSPRVGVVCVLVAALAFGAVVLLGAFAGGPRHTTSAAASAGTLPLSFIENRGQVDGRARYYMQGKDASVFFTSRGLAFSLAGRKRSDRRWGLKLDFLGAQGHPRPVGRARTSAKVSYFKGRRKDWKTGLSTYSKVAYRGVWPGVDLVYSGAGGNLKYSFLVRPGADPKAIRLGLRGASAVAVNPRGQLEVSTPARKLRDDAPVSYQRVNGRRVPVSSSYSLGAKHSYGFRVGGYDRSKPLVIDPAVLVNAGYIGGSSDEQANKVAVDDAGNAYVVGFTTSADFPTVGPATSFGGDVDDAFIAKVKADGSGLAYASYLGGSGRDQAINATATGDGNVYLGGTTSSTNFPGGAGFGPTFHGGGQDAWLAKVNPSGGLVYSGFIGGTAAGDPAGNNEQTNGIAVDGAGNAYASGFTVSPDALAPYAAANGYSKTFSPSPIPGIPDAFLVKVNPAGSAVTYATYIGGGGGDAATDVAVDGTGKATVAMYTGSNEDPLGPAPNPFGGYNGVDAAKPGFDKTFNGEGPAPDDAGQVKLDTTVNGAASLLAGTYIGGAAEEHPFDNAIDSAGNTYLTGETHSDATNNADSGGFPNGTGFGPIPGFDQTLNSGGSGDPEQPNDAFLVKLSPDLSAMTYGTYIGGSGNDDAIGVDVPTDGSFASIFGTTASSDGSFPAVNGPDTSYNGGPSDAFIATLNSPGTGLSYSGFIGGSLQDQGFGVTLRGGSAYVTGNTDSDQCADGFPVHGGPRLSKAGGFGSFDAFVAKIDPSGAATPGGGPSCSAAPPGTPSATPPPSGGGGDGGGSIPPKATVCANSSGVRVIGRTNSGGRVIQGTNGNNRICGTSAGDVITGNGGKDVISGGGGNDRINGGSGSDRINGGSGKDLISGGSGNDSVNGSSGNDRVNGNSGKDRITGSSGNDRLNGSTGNDVVSGSSGRDVISGSSGSDRLSGNSGNDRINGNSGNDRISGGSGNDRLKGGSGNDRIDGGPGKDRISGGSGRDRVKQ